MIKAFWKRNRTKILYNNCEIPAKLFYNEVIGKSNLSVLGAGTPQQLNDALYGIIDELCELEDNREMLAIYSKRKKILGLQEIIGFIDETLKQISYLKLTHEERLIKINRLNGLPSIEGKSKFDPNKEVKQEIIRWQRSILGMFKNRLKMEQDDDKEKSKEAVTTFEEMTVYIFKTTGYKVTDTDTLRTFSVYKKDAIKTNKEIRAKNGK